MMTFLKPFLKNDRGSKRLLTGVLVIFILAIGAGTAFALIISKPKSPRVQVKSQAVLVQTLTAKVQNIRVIVHQNGSVIAAQSIELRPEVSGIIAEQSPELIPGGRFEVGEVMLQIDKRDYEYLVEQRVSQLEDAKFTLTEEQGKKLVADREWKLLGSDVKTTKSGRDLALRIPHISRAEAAVEAAKSALLDAKLELERTTIRAPFNSFVQTENVDLGQYLTPQTAIASLIGTDYFWVQVSLPVDELRWIYENGEAATEGSKVRVFQKNGFENIERVGKVVRLAGDIRPSTRTARLLVRIDDPLGLEKSSVKSAVPLLIGAWVDVAFEGKTLENVFVLPRKAVREGSQVWVLSSQNTLDMRTVRVVKTQPDDTVIVDKGLGNGDKVILSRISTPLPGMKLEISQDSVKGQS